MSDTIKNSFEAISGLFRHRNNELDDASSTIKNTVDRLLPVQLPEQEIGGLGAAAVEASNFNTNKDESKVKIAGLNQTDSALLEAENRELMMERAREAALDARIDEVEASKLEQVNL